MNLPSLRSESRPVKIGPDYVDAARTYPEKPVSAHSDNGLIDYWRMLRRHKTAIFVTSLAGLAIGFGVGIPMKPMYRARTSIEVLNLNEDFMNMKQTNPTTTNDNSYDTSEEQTQTTLLQSNALMRRVLAKLNPGDIDSGAGRAPTIASSGWRHWLHWTERAPVSQRAARLGSLAHSLKVQTATRTRVIEATADSTDPRLAADFLNTLIAEFVQQNMEARYATTHLTSDWLTREIDDARANLKRSEGALQEYARSSGLIFTNENTNVATEKLRQIQQELSGATAERIARQARFELARNSPPDTIADVLSDPGLKDVGAKVNDLRRQVANLSAVYNPEFSQLRRAEAELAVDEAAFVRTRADILKRIENDYQEALSKEQLLARAYDAGAGEVTGQDEKAIQYNILKREVDSARQLYDTMLQQTKQASIASAMRASNVRVVDPATPPETPVAPDFRMNSTIGLVLGLLFSVVFVSIRERADRTLRQPGDINLWTNLAELGTIPSAGMKKVPVGGWRVRRALSPTRGRTGSAVELMTWQNKPGLIAEGFRSALTSILFTGDSGSRPRVMVFTSANASDGKTTVVSNIAIAAAEIRHKVLVIDADLRRPRIHTVFGVPNERGLSDLLLQKSAGADGAGLVQQTAIPGVHVLTAGTPIEGASHLLYSPGFETMLTRFRAEYDMVLIDTPPMLQMTDARVAARLADAVVLIVRSGQTTRDAILAAKDRLTEDCIPVLGTILNDWNPGKSSGGYYGQYTAAPLKAYKAYA